jgi:hypothetical protein
MTHEKRRYADDSSAGTVPLETSRILPRVAVLDRFVSWCDGLVTFWRGTSGVCSPGLAPYVGVRKSVSRVVLLLLLTIVELTSCGSASR